jgi:transcriptional regulator with PAS, ATPase and Fis domain
MAELFHAHSWPGNMREMKNICERIVLSAEAGGVDLATVRLMLEDLVSTPLPLGNPPVSVPSGTLEEIKRQAIAAALREEGYNKSRAAKRLGIDRATIDRLL